MDTIISQFEKWYEDNRNFSYITDTEFIKSEYGSAYLDIETPTVFARAVLWDKGFCNLEVLEIEEDKPMTGETFVFASWEEARPIIENFLKKLDEG